MDYIKLAQRTISILSSMIESGECHTTRTKEMVNNAQNGLEQLRQYNVVGRSEQLNYGFKKLDIVEWKGVNLKIVYIHEDTQQASIETLPDNNNYNIYKVPLKQLTKVI